MTQEPGNPSSHEISEEVFRHLVDLAAFHLDDDEAEYLLRELNEQLKSIRELDAIEVKGDVSITSHGVPYSDAMRLPLREDHIEASTMADDILEQAPQADGRSIVVPDIPHEDLS